MIEIDLQIYKQKISWDLLVFIKITDRDLPQSATINQNKKTTFNYFLT
jgi:hypothetical protein